jgi:hypothetical protein
MTLTITLPEKMAERIQRKAEERHLSAEEITVDLLQGALDHDATFQADPSTGYKPMSETDDDFPTPEEVVARFMALPPESNNVRPVRGSLAEALRNKPTDPNFRQRLSRGS